MADTEGFGTAEHSDLEGFGEHQPEDIEEFGNHNPDGNLSEFGEHQPADLEGFGENQPASMDGFGEGGGAPVDGPEDVADVSGEGEAAEMLEDMQGGMGEGERGEDGMGEGVYGDKGYGANRDMGMVQDALEDYHKSNDESMGYGNNGNPAGVSRAMEYRSMPARPRAPMRRGRGGMRY